jgi:hypothetical protein
MLRLRKVRIQDGDLGIIQVLDPRAVLNSLEQDWATHAVYSAKRHRPNWIEARVERLARPSEHVSINGDLGESPIALGENPEWIAHVLGHADCEMLWRVYSRYVPNMTRKDGSALDAVVRKAL